jgi:hypothetical protein
LLPIGADRRPIMRSRLLAMTPFISLAVAAFVACGSPATTTTPAGASGSTSGAAGGGSGASGSGMTSGSGTSSGSSTDASTDTGPIASHPVLKSAGCGMIPTIATGQWVRQPMNCDQGAAEVNCQPIPVGSTPVQMPAKGAPEWRGWWTYLPSSYDPSKAYRVIYNAINCGAPYGFNAGQGGLSYQHFDNDDAILVGLDYDTYSDLPGCYDYRSPNSNDFLFFPWLQAKIESEFCVDINHEFFSGYDSGAFVAQQFNCAFPDKLRGTIAVSGCEPGTASHPADPNPGAQPPCVSKPMAAFYAKDPNDQDETYACIIPACQRVLAQNGCMVNGAVPKCDPQDKTSTSPYPIPASLANVVNAARVNLGCVQFNGCPADYPVVFCTYTDVTNRHGDTQSWGGPALYWDWMRNQLAN